MSNMIQAANNTVIENVRVLAIDTATTSIELSGANGRILHVTCGTSGSSVPTVIVSGDFAYLEDVNTSLSADAGVLVTGDRAQLVGITSRLVHFSTGHGIRLDQSSDTVINGFASYQDGFGLVVLDSPRCQATDVHVFDCSRVGVWWDGSDNGLLECTVGESDRHGVQITDSDRGRFSGQVVNASRGTNNTYDGVILDGDSDRNRTEFTVTYLGSGNRMRYGLNISAATCNTNVEASILDGTGATGNYNNAGTGTVVTDDHLV